MAKGKITIKGTELSGLKSYIDSITAHKNSCVHVGVLSRGDFDGVSNAQKMATLEFGASITRGSSTTVVPARAPFRKTIAKQKKEWSKAFSIYLSQAIRSGKVTIRDAFTQIGDVMAVDVQQTIEQGLKPALKPATVAQKVNLGLAEHADKAGIRFGDLIASITSEYVDNGGGK